MASGLFQYPLIRFGPVTTTSPIAPHSTGPPFGSKMSTSTPTTGIPALATSSDPICCSW